jgi:TIR domain
MRRGTRDMTGIFISYCRLESKLQARILFERLEPRFRGRVFMDTDGLKHGENFRDKIGAQLERCTVLLALIGPQWEAVRDGKGAGGWMIRVTGCGWKSPRRCSAGSRWCRC